MNSYFSIYLLLFSSILMMSCNNRQEINLSNSNIKTASTLIDTIPNSFLKLPKFNSNANQKIDKTNQVGEYLIEIFQDSNGNLWFGTLEKGVARYDGKSLTYFTTKDGLAGNQVNEITEDKEGKMWFGFSGGLFLFNGMEFINITQNGPWF